MTLEVLVRSRGRRLTQDYRWLPLGDAETRVLDAVPLGNLASLRSVLALWRDAQGRLVLFIGGLLPDPPVRDQQGRDIRIDLLVRGEEADELRIERRLLESLVESGSALSSQLVTWWPEDPGFAAGPGLDTWVDGGSHHASEIAKAAVSDKWGANLDVQVEARRAVANKRVRERWLFVASADLTDDWCYRHRPLRAIGPRLPDGPHEQRDIQSRPKAQRRALQLAVLLAAAVLVVMVLALA